MPTHALKAMWTVRVGLWPNDGDTMPQRTKQWVYTSEDYAADCEATKGEARGPHPEKPPTRFETRRNEATAYWTEANDPAYQNWAELTFTWI